MTVPAMRGLWFLLVCVFTLNAQTLPVETASTAKSWSLKWTAEIWGWRTMITTR